MFVGAVCVTNSTSPPPPPAALAISYDLSRVILARESDCSLQGAQASLAIDGCDVHCQPSPELKQIENGYVEPIISYCRFDDANCIAIVHVSPTATMAKRRQHRGSILRVQTGAPTALIARNSFSANTHLTSGRRRPQQQGGSSNSPLRLVHHQRGTSFGAFSVGPNGAVPTRTSRHARTPGGASVTFQDIDAIVPPARMQALSAETGPRVHQALGQACEDLSMLSKRGGSGRRKGEEVPAGLGPTPR